MAEDAMARGPGVFPWWLTKSGGKARLDNEFSLQVHTRWEGGPTDEDKD